MANTICFKDNIVCHSTSSGINIKDVDLDISNYISMLGVNTLWALDSYLYIGTTNSGIIRAEIDDIYLNNVSSYKIYPQITSNEVLCLHGNGIYLAAITSSGIDRIDITTNSGINTISSGINGCFQTTVGSLYYTDGNTLSVIYAPTTSLDYIDYNYTIGDGIVPENVYINDLSVIEGDLNLIYMATTSGVVVIEENRDDETDSRVKYFYLER